MEPAMTFSCVDKDTPGAWLMAVFLMPTDSNDGPVWDVMIVRRVWTVRYMWAREWEDERDGSDCARIDEVLMSDDAKWVQYGAS